MKCYLPTYSSLLFLFLLHRSSGLWLGECNKPLGVSTGDVQDAALTASSSHDHIVGPHRARLGMDSGGGAWCPRPTVDSLQKEWLEVDLGAPHLVTAVATQGRHFNGHGVEYTPAYTLTYWRPGMADFAFYIAHMGHGNKTLLVGNSDTYTEVKNILARPLLATKVRLQPFSAHPRVVCLRLELYGCNYTEGLQSYSVGGGDPTTYVGAGVGEVIDVGEGPLFDGRVGTEDVLMEAGVSLEAQNVPQIEGLEPAPDTPVVITFIFDGMRKFRGMFLYLTTSQVQRKAEIKASVALGWNTSTLDEARVTSSWSGLEPAGPHNLTLSLKNRPAALLQLTLQVSAVEVNLIEVYFDSRKCEWCKLGDWERRKVTQPEEHTATRPRHPPADVWAVYTAHQHRTYVGIAVGFSVGVGVLVVVWAGVWLRRKRGKASSPRVFRRPPPDTLDMKSLMEGVGFGMGVSMGGHNTPTYEEGSCLLYDDHHQKTPPTTPHSTIHSIASRPLTPPDTGPVYATPTLTTLRTSSTFPSNSSFNPIPRPLTLPAIPCPTPPIQPPPQSDHRRIQVPSVSCPWMTCMYRQEEGRPQITNAAQSLSPQNLTRTQLLASGAFATVSVGVVNECSEMGLDGGETDDTPTLPAALITVTSHDILPAAATHAQLLASLRHVNVCGLLGVVGGAMGVTLVLEYQPDAHLPEYLSARTLAPSQNTHNMAENGLSNEDQTISVCGALTLAVQVAAGMTYLESRGVTHTDLACRNVIMAGGLAKVSQVGTALPRYSHDYWRPPDGRGPAPLRWISPEALCQSNFTSASDVWSFGVTLWEILTLARRRPHHHLSDDLLFHALLTTHAYAQPNNSSHGQHTYAPPQTVLSPPAWCPREVHEVMSSCWRPQANRRPSFATIHHTLNAYVNSHK